MRLYKVKIPVIAHEVIEALIVDGSIEVQTENRSDAELDLVAIMEEFVRRDIDLRETVREHMARRKLPYEMYGKVRTALAEEWNHPTGDDIERYLTRQIMENFMISPSIEEVFGEDREMFRRIIDILKSHDVDERALREEAMERIQNIPEGTVDYEIALSRAMKEVKKRHGLIR